MKPPLLTLITITKDDSAGLARTLASAQALRGGGAEHLVVDGAEGGSSEKPENAGELGIQVLLRSPRGIADAFNAGIAAARGEWVWCLNGGDCVDARVIPERLFGMLTESRADVVIAGTTYEGESDPRPHPAETLRWPPLRSWIPHPSTLVRQRLFIQNGLFDERYTIAMDYEWWLRAIPTGAGVEVTNLPLAVFAPGGMSQRAENFPIVRREQRAAWRKHRVALGLSWTDLATRSLKASLAAFVEQRRKFHRVQ